MVTRCDHHAGLGVDSLDVVGCPGNARRGVASGGLQQDLAVPDIGQLLLDELAIVLVGDEHDVLDRHDALDAVKCHLEQRAASAEEINELLG